jgi:hypothetical protein
MIRYLSALFLTLTVTSAVQTTHPKVTSISSDPKVTDGKREGSVHGGTKLSIRGNNFNIEDPGATVITVGGSVCKTVEFRAEDSYIQCSTPPAADKT